MKNFTLKLLAVLFMVFTVVNGNAQKKVAYITSDKTMDASAADPENDPIIKLLQADDNFEITVFAVAGDATVDLAGFDVAVVQEGFSSSAAILKPGGSAGLANIPIPFVYNKPYAIRDTRAVSSGSPTGASDAAGLAVTVDPGDQDNELFNGITFTDNTFSVFYESANDDGSDGDYALMYVSDVTLDPTTTLLGTVAEITDPGSSLFLNDIPAGSSIGSETLQARMIALGLSFGAICKDGGYNLTTEGLTLWRNAVYSLAGLEVPANPAGGAGEGEVRKVVYITADKEMGEGFATVDNDPILRFLRGDENFEVTEFYLDPNSDSAVDFSGFHLAVLQESLWSTAPLYSTEGTAGLSNIDIPFIHTKLYSFRDGRGTTSGSPVGGSETAGVSITVDPANQDNELFNAITFTDNAFDMFHEPAVDASGENMTIIYVTGATLNPTNTLLGTVDEITNADSAICINDFPAGSQIGSETLKARMITIGTNFSSVCLDNGDNLTTNGLTLWRNALYSLGGIRVPDTPAEIKSTTKKVAYITADKTMEEGAADPENDPVIKLLEEDFKFELTVFAVAGDSVVDLEGFDLAVVQEGFGSTSQILKPGGSAGLANMEIPFIYTKMYAIRDGRGVVSGSPTGAADVANLAITVEPANQGNELFNGITFTNDAFEVFVSTANDEGGDGDITMNYTSDVTLDPTNTLLGTVPDISSAETTVFLNDFPAGSSIGSETLQARMIAIGMNFGAICKYDGLNLASGGLTLWRNALYSLAGFEVPTTAVEVDEPELPKNIILLTDTSNNAGGDVAQFEWLKDNGFDITRLDIGSDIDLTNPEQAVIDQLNSAGLVIIGRDANSGKYDGRGQDIIDSIRAPVITTNPYGARWGVPKMWFKDAQMAEASGEEIWISVTDDEIFAHANVVGDSINYATGSLGLITTEGTHNGTVIGAIGDQMGIIRFDKGVPYNDSEDAKTPLSERTIFSFDTGPGTFTLSEDGQAAYYGEICRMLDLPIEAPAHYYVPDKSFTKIILLTDTSNNDGDVAQHVWLEANGFDVTKLDIGNGIDMTDPGLAVIAQLNAADLVIVGRDANSSKYDGTGQDVIDNITAPVITNNPYGARWGVPKMWFKDADMAAASGDSIWISVASDEIFANCNVVGDSMCYASSSLGLITTAGTHNGTVIGAIGEQMAIIRFDKNVPYNDSVVAKTPKSDRTIFSFDVGENSFNLSENGQAAYFAEICRLTGLPIEAPEFYYSENLQYEILLLTDVALNGGGDVAQYEWLKMNGFNIKRLDIGTEVDMTDPGQEVINQMNSVDLVIVGRDAYSSKYDGAGQDVIDNITAPVITVNPFGAKWGVPQMWFKDPSNTEVSGDSIWITVTSDAIFENSHIVGDSMCIASGSYAMITTPGTHNGTVIGSIGEQMGIIRFEKDVPYNDSTTAKTPSSERTIFSFNTGMNSFTLTDDGQAAYYGEICRMMGLDIEAPLYYYENPNSSLASLETTEGTLSPEFAPGTYSYSLVVPEGTTSLTLTATPDDPEATVTGDGQVSEIPSTVVITVVSNDGSTTSNYEVNISHYTAVKEPKAASVLIYPNPARDYIMIDGLEGEARVCIYSITGQVVSNTLANSNTLRVDLNEYNPGIYLVRVVVEGELYTSRFIKQ